MFHGASNLSVYSAFSLSFKPWQCHVLLCVFFFFITDLQVFSFVSKMNCRPLSWTIKSLFLYFQFFFQDKVSPLYFKPYHCVGRFSEVQLYFMLDATTGMSCTYKFLNSTVKLSNRWDMRSDRQTWQIGNVMLLFHNIHVMSCLCILWTLMLIFVQLF